MQHILVSDVMTRHFASVSGSATLAEVVAIMHQNGHSCVVIVEDGRPEGIVTERDMVTILAAKIHDAATMAWPVSRVMSSPPVCVAANATLSEALVVSMGREIRHLPVVDGQDQLLGILTQRDISRGHLAAIERQRDLIEKQIQMRTLQLQKANEELKQLSLQDALLHIGNRRAMEMDLHYTHANAKRYGHAYAIALIDVDYFKRYNDFYGHQAGDAALIDVTRQLQQMMRTGDRLYRYGGEELLLLLQDVADENATLVVERIREGLYQAQLPHANSPLQYLTFSAGLEWVKPDDDGWEALVNRADESLYRAKARGRNCIVSSGAPDEACRDAGG